MSDGVGQDDLDSTNSKDRPSAEARTMFDYTMPPVAWVRDGLEQEDADWSASDSELSAAWAAMDGADSYEYGIGTGPGSPDVVGWTGVGLANSVTRGGLDLNACHRYHFLVRALRGAALSEPAASDGVLLDRDPPVSWVCALPETSRYANRLGIGYIIIYWDGWDRLSGIHHYDVQYRRGSSGEWRDVLVGTTLKEAGVFSFGGRYEFRCRAADRVGNVEPIHPGPDTWTYFTTGYEIPHAPKPGYIKMALHLAPHGTHSCGSPPSIDSREDLVRSWASPGEDLDVFVVVFGYDSLMTLEYGLDWPPEWGTGSTRACAGADRAGNITMPGDGQVLYWPSCQVKGEKPAFYSVSCTWLAPSSSGLIWLTEWPESQGGAGLLGATDCRDYESRANHFADSIFCAAVGVDPYEGAWLGPPEMKRIRALFK